MTFVCLRQGSKPEGDTDVLEDTRVEAVEDEQPDEMILCAACRFPITAREQEIAVSGAHAHVFANPHGMVFEIGCFRNAPGGVRSTESSTEFTWFPGFRWHLALCRGCRQHLGWYFASDSDTFWGLILDHLLR